ncbi:hypothetical protein LTR37_011993 [Vermiconidia calcicola]|uniref:Uncharacterized protein n=1 Tax=Vermiconidia calcicola TaxID=1690605 RepID=A0ACC3N0G6_9PEZI|nr:hypothetical protein LTR37_011993 [Vermiconidia calcicola]
MDAPANKTALVSGGARGIGRAIVRRFLERGYRVFVFDIDEDELKHACLNNLKKWSDSGSLSYAVCNLRDTENIREKVDEAAKFLNGSIDVLVNNGGIASPQWKDGKTMWDYDTLPEWQAYIETNLTAPFVVSQAAIQHMKIPEASGPVEDDNDSNAGPCIIHIGSFRAHQSDPNQEGYASSKAGQLGLMHSMAVSLKSLGIRVNLVAPGRIKVEHESKAGEESGISWADQNQEKDVQDHAANRAGRPADICDAVEYLVNAGFVTGQDITVDGGATRQK